MSSLRVFFFCNYSTTNVSLLNQKTFVLEGLTTSMSIVLTYIGGTWPSEGLQVDKALKF